MYLASYSEPQQLAGLGKFVKKAIKAPIKVAKFGVTAPLKPKKAIKTAAKAAKKAGKLGLKLAPVAAIAFPGVGTAAAAAVSVAARSAKKSAAPSVRSVQSARSAQSVQSVPAAAPRKKKSIFKKIGGAVGSVVKKAAIPLAVGATSYYAGGQAGKAVGGALTASKQAKNLRQQQQQAQGQADLYAQGQAQAESLPELYRPAAPGLLDGLPTWALPAGLGVGALLLVLAVSGRKS